MQLSARRNETLRTEEQWQPPAFQPATGRAGRLKAAVRRTLDLQAASLWRDLAPALAQARGAVLDVGAGAQPYRELVGRQATYRAIDTADARENFKYDIPDTQYFEGTVWPVEDTSIDLVIATETLEHVPDTGRFLDEANRVLKPGGQVLLTIPFSARWHYVPYDYWRFTPSGLKMVLERAGFDDVVVHARGNEVTVAAAKCMALILPFLLPQGEGLQVVRRSIGLILSPLMIALGLVGQRSLRREGGEDCLGYTALARKSSDHPSSAAH